MVGQGDTGQLGLGEDIMEKKKPSPVGGALSGLRVVQVACGGMHTAALTDGGEVCSYSEPVCNWLDGPPSTLQGYIIRFFNFVS